MKLKQYIKHLEQLLEQHGNVNVICASDDEGNYFSEVAYQPAACRFNKKDPEDIKFLNSDPRIKVNAVCVN